MSYTKEQRIVNQSKPKAVKVEATPISSMGDSDMILPNHSGIASHPEAISTFPTLAGDNIFTGNNTFNANLTTAITSTVTLNGIGTINDGLTQVLSWGGGGAGIQGLWDTSAATLYGGTFLGNGTDTVGLSCNAADELYVQKLFINNLRINDSSADHVYTIAPAELSADRTLNLPLITATDTLATLGLAQTFTATQTFNTDAASTTAIIANVDTGDIHLQTQINGSNTAAIGDILSLGITGVLTPSGGISFFAAPDGSAYMAVNDAANDVTISGTTLTISANTYLNGFPLFLDADDDSRIQEISDDVIGLYLNAAEEYRFAANRLTFNNGTTDTYIDFSTDGQLDIGVNATSELIATASKIRIANELEIDGALNHDGTTVGFYNVTPVTRPAAYTQTYATATRTHSNLTSATLTDSTGGTANTTCVAISGTGDDANINNNMADMIAQINALRVDLENAKQVLNQVIDDHQANGLLQ